MERNVIFPVRVKSDQPAIRVVMMPRDTNHQGNVFGGVLLAYIDQAGFVEAKKHAYHTYVTASIDRVDFLKPVFVGDTASFYTSVEKVGTTSIAIQVEVFVHRADLQAAKSPKEVLACTAKLTYVALDDRTNRPTPILDDQKIPQESS